MMSEKCIFYVDQIWGERGKWGGREETSIRLTYIWTKRQSQKVRSPQQKKAKDEQSRNYSKL
jgi:hypothetical protein